MGQPAIKIVNEIQACREASVGTELNTLAGASAERVGAADNTFFRMATFYGVKSFSSGSPTNNSANINLGHGSTELPIAIPPGESVVIEAPDGAKYDLYDFYFKGTTGDGVHVIYS